MYNGLIYVNLFWLFLILESLFLDTPMLYVIIAIWLKKTNTQVCWPFYCRNFLISDLFTFQRIASWILYSFWINLIFIVETKWSLNLSSEREYHIKRSKLPKNYVYFKNEKKKLVRRLFKSFVRSVILLIRRCWMNQICLNIV